MVPTNTTITSPPIVVGVKSAGASLKGKNTQNFVLFLKL